MDQFNTAPQQQEDGIDVKDLLFKILGFWPFIVASMIIGLSVSFVVNRYSRNIYELATVLNVEEADNPLGSSGVSLAFNLGGMNKLESKEAVLRSYTLHENVARKLGWEVSYYGTGRLIESELYKTVPYEVVFDFNHPQPLDVRFTIDNENGTLNVVPEESDKWNGKRYTFSSAEESSAQNPELPNGRFSLNEWITGSNYKFKIIERLGGENNQNVTFQFNSYDAVAKSNLITIKTATGEDRGSTMMTLSAQGNEPEKIADLLNEVSAQLREYELSRKNAQARSTIAFIDEQLSSTLSALQVSEESLESFRADNLIVDIGVEGSQLIEQFVTIEQQSTELNLVKSYYRYIIDFLSSASSINEFSFPTLTGIEDELVAQLADQLITLSTSIDAYRYSLSADNPAIKELEEQIGYTKRSLKQGAENALEHTQIMQNDLSKRKSAIQDQISKLPAIEQRMINIQRQYEITGRQYELLLEKRAEAGILQASNLPDTQIIDQARFIGQAPIGPNRKRNLALGLMLGMFLPMVFVVIKDLLNNKIMGRNDIESQTAIPLLGILGHAKQDDNLVVFSKPKSSVSEAFRALRSNLNFLLTPVSSGGQIILVTSSIGGEGKTFTAINLASVLALSGKKTCLVGLDLRKPKIFNDFGLSNDKGISTLLSNQGDSLSDIIQPSGKEYLDIISAGPVPPNPSELLEQKAFNQVLLDLRSRYDYVVLDTPPMGLVADSLQIIPQVDGTIYVSRFNYTQKELLGFVNQQYEEKKLSQIGLSLIHI